MPDLETSCIFGGAFDPIHSGHLYMAHEISKRYKIGRFIWVPTFAPAHRPASGTLFHHRCKMVELATSSYKDHFVSDIESKLPHPSYALNSIMYFKKRFTSTKDWFLLIGADNWTIFKTWYKWEEILNEIKILIYPRSGHQVSGLPNNVELLDMKEKDITSSEIRAKLKAGIDLPESALNPSVKYYIWKNDLY